MHCNPLLWLHLPLVNNRAKRRNKPAPQARCSCEVDFLGKLYKVDVCVVDRHVLGERAPTRKPRLELVIANLVIARFALRTRTAPADERQCDPVARLPIFDVRTYIFDDAGEFVTGNVREADVGVMSHPAMPVAPAESRRLYSNDDSADRWYRVRQFLDGHGSTEFPVYRRFQSEAWARPQKL